MTYRIPHQPDELVLYSVWDVSTVHIAESDAKLLGGGHPLVVTYEYPEGWWLHVDSDLGDDQDKVMKELLEAGFSPAFTHLLSVARRHNVDWIRLDGDGEIYEYLSQHHW